MDTRTQIAAMAMQGLLSLPDNTANSTTVALASVEYADALLSMLGVPAAGDDLAKWATELKRRDAAYNALFTSGAALDYRDPHLQAMSTWRFNATYAMECIALGRDHAERLDEPEPKPPPPTDADLQQEYEAGAAAEVAASAAAAAEADMAAAQQAHAQAQTPSDYMPF